MGRHTATVFAALVLFGVRHDGTAHHAPVEFELRGNARVELVGELIDVAWRNPHPQFALNVQNAVGSSVVWAIELRGTLAHLQRSGVSADLFGVGDRVTIAGVPSRRRERVMLGTHVLLPTGTQVLLSEFDRPRWSESHVGGAGGWTLDESRVRRVASDGRGFFRVWSFPDRTEHGAAFSSLQSAMRPEALARGTTAEQYNRIAFECKPLSMPYVMVHPVNIELVDRGELLELRIGHFDAVRQIHMSDVPPLDDRTPSPLGYSVGRWEGGSLVVETRHISAPYASVMGMSQTPDMHVAERFSLQEEHAVLAYEMTLADHDTFEGPAVYRFYYVALGEDLGQFECRGD